MKTKTINLNKVVKIKFYKQPNKIIRKILKSMIYQDLINGKNIDKYMQNYFTFEVVLDLVGDFNKIQEFIDKAES